MPQAEINKANAPSDLKQPEESAVGNVQIVDVVIASGALKPTYSVPVAASSRNLASPVLPADAPNGSIRNVAASALFKCNKVSGVEAKPRPTFPIVPSPVEAEIANVGISELKPALSVFVTALVNGVI